MVGSWYAEHAQTVHFRHPDLDFVVEVVPLVCRGDFAGTPTRWRLVFCYEQQSKFAVFGAAKPEVMNDTVISAAVDFLLQKKNACSNCTDRFTDKWVERLTHQQEGIRGRAWRSLSNMLAALRVCSVKVEKKHLLGQELNKHKQRGRAPSAKTLAKRTYHALIARSSQRQTDLVKETVIGNISKQKQFSQSMAAFKVKRWKKRNATGELAPNALAALRQGATKARSRKATAYSKFMSQKMSEQAGGMNAKREAALLQWTNASAETKAVFQGLADNENDQVARGVGGFSAEAISSNSSSFKPQKLQTVKRAKTAATMEAMEQHEIWKAGLRLGGMSTPLKPSLVSSASDKVVAAGIDKMFQFDATIQPKPPVPFKMNLTCPMLHGGLCYKDQCTAAGDLGSRNVYNVLMQHGLKALATDEDSAILLNPNWH